MAKRALKLLYLRHHDRVRRFVMHLTGNESTAEEVVNEVFLEAWRHAGEFEGRSQVATWLMSIARFKTISECRRRSEAQLDENAAAAIEDPSDNPRPRWISVKEATSCRNIWRNRRRSTARKALNSLARPLIQSRPACTMQDTAWPNCLRRLESIGPGCRSDRAL
jgi:RNA polymerase sigma factor (sigma-70 family)